MIRAIGKYGVCVGCLSHRSPRANIVAVNSWPTRFFVGLAWPPDDAVNALGLFDYIGRVSTRDLFKLFINQRLNRCCAHGDLQCLG